MQQPEVQIDVEKAVQRKSRRRTHVVVVVSVLACLVGALALAVRSAMHPPAERPVAIAPLADAASAPADPPGTLSDLSSPDLPDGDQLIDDDGRTLWVSPTQGTPIDLSWLSPGCQVFLELRPATLLSHPEGENVVAALGPAGQLGIEAVEQAVGIRLEAIDRLLIGLRATPEGAWVASYVVRPTDPASIDEAVSHLSVGETHEHNGAQYVRSGELAYYVASINDAPLLVVTPVADMPEVLDLGGTPPPLRRDMERLVAASDSQRNISLLFVPHYLAADGKSTFDGAGQRLKEPLEWLLGEGLTAVSLSLHWGDDFFMELRAASTIDTRAHRLAQKLAQRLSEVPSQVEEHVFNLQLSPYSRRLLARFPEMVRTAIRYTRHGYEQDHAVVRSYLPIAAGQNLLLAGELALVEPLRSTTTIEPNASREQSTEQRLARVTSLSISRDTLEAALAMLADDIGVQIELAGQDLQSEGITKNQSFGIDLQDRPAAEILAEILRLANPDKAATGLDDPRQKLVYVVRDAPPGVVVTTRAAAVQRGESLPVVFQVQE